MFQKNIQSTKIVISFSNVNMNFVAIISTLNHGRTLRELFNGAATSLVYKSAPDKTLKSKQR